MKNIAIFVFNDVEVLDFAGPFEVFSITGRRDGSNPFNVYLVAENPGAIAARNQFSVNPPYSFANCPDPDILLIPGGGGYTADGKPFGTRREMDNLAVRDWVQRQAEQVELLLSVCTGALILAKAGLLEGRRATTHHQAIDSLRQLAPNTEVTLDRIVDNGDLILSGGISAGIDMSLYVVAKLLGREVAIETATYMEYDWRELSSTSLH